MEEKKNDIRLLLIIGAIVLLTFAYNLIVNPQGIKTVFSTTDLPDENQLTFSQIDWALENKLTIQGWQIGYHPGFVGNLTSGNISAFHLNNPALSGTIPLISKDGRYVTSQSQGTLYIASMDKVVADNYSVAPDSYIDVLDKEYRCSHAWSPDSNRLASVCLAPNDRITISTFDITKKVAQDLFEYHEKYIGDIEGASWSFDGTMLAFSLRYDHHDNQLSQVDIFIYSFGTESLVRLTNTPKMSERSPAWYPDRKILTFTSTKEGDSEVTDSHLVFSTEDGECMKSLPDLKGLVSPSWSPDGSQLAYIDFWTTIMVLDTSQYVPPDFLSHQGLCTPEGYLP